MNKKKETIFLTIFLALVILLFLQRWTGGIWHAILGVILSGLTMIHVGRQMKKMKYKKFSARLVDWVLTAALIVIFFTGMLLHPLQNIMIIKILHKLSSVIFVIGAIIHIVQHKARADRPNSR